MATGTNDYVNPLLYIHWVIAGGESGHKARPMHPDWARSLRDQCKAAGVSYFFKQWGEHCWPSQMPADTFRGWDFHHGTEGRHDQPWKVGKKAAGHLLDGKEHHEWPRTIAATQTHQP